MSTFKLKASRQVLAVAMGFAVSASALAALTSTPTGTVIGRAPTMAPPTVNYTDNDANGLLTVGDTLIVVDGAFTDLDGDMQIGSVYYWQVDGQQQVGNSDTYVIKAADAGKNIRVTARPQTDPAITDPWIGMLIWARGGSADPDRDGTIIVEIEGALLSVAVSGYVSGRTPQVGTLLTATPACDRACGTITYQWQIEDVRGSSGFVDIPGSTAATYMPVGGDQGRRIKVVASNPAP